MRLSRDVVFIGGGIIALLVSCWRGIRHRRPTAPAGHVEDQLFVEQEESWAEDHDTTQEHPS